MACCSLSTLLINKMAFINNLFVSSKVRGYVLFIKTSTLQGVPQCDVRTFFKPKSLNAVLKCRINLTKSASLNFLLQSSSCIRISCRSAPLSNFFNFLSNGFHFVSHPSIVCFAKKYDQLWHFLTAALSEKVAKFVAMIVIVAGYDKLRSRDYLG